MKIEEYNKITNHMNNRQRLELYKEYCNLQSEMIPMYLSLSESLEHSLKEVSLIWKD
jgi:hypothetical protein